MKEQHIQTLLFNYFSGMATPEEEKEIWLWLEADEQNKKIFAELSDWWAMIHAPLFKSEMKADFVKHFGMISSAGSFRKKKFNIGILAKIAASLLILMTIGALGYGIGRTSFITEDKVVYLETTVPFGSNSRITLPDESEVWINAGSTLIYKEDKKKNIREVELNGEAYFDVAPDASKPFIIKTNGLDVKVVGTSFNVKAYEEEETVDVTLVTGKVNVFIPGKEQEEEMIPNTLLSYHRDTKDVSVAVVTVADLYAWRDGVIRFSDKTFTQLIPQLERKFNMKIQVESAQLSQEIFSGSFTADHTLRDILQEIDVEHKYAWNREGTTMIIRDR